MNQAIPIEQHMVIFDIDGTLADTRHREHFVQVPEGTPKDWDGFFAAQASDTLRMDVVRVLDMYMQSGIYIQLLTGRGEEYREVTEQWLKDYYVAYDNLTMRPAGNRTNDDILKMEAIKQWEAEGWKIIGLYDDRKRICDAARAHGITVFQMAEGNF